MANSRTPRPYESKGPDGLTYSVLKEYPQTGDSFHYKLASAPTVDVVQGESLLGNERMITGARFSPVKRSNCLLAFPYLPLLKDLNTTTDNADLFYNTGHEIFIRMDGIYYRRASREIWSVITEKETPGTWSKLLHHQKEVFTERLKGLL